MKCLSLGALLLLFMLTIVVANEQPFRNFAASFNRGCNRSICKRNSPEVLPTGTISDVAYHQLPNILYLHGSLVSTPNGVNDTLHVVFSTFGGFPAVLVVHCNASSDLLTFNWDILLSNSTSKFGGIQQPASCQNAYSFALVAVSVVDFNDTLDDAKLEEASPNATVVVPFDRLGWMRMANTSDPNVIQVQTDPLLDSAQYFTNNGTLKFRLAISEVVGFRPLELPHLEFTGNSVQLDILFDSWLSQFVNTRIAIELMLVAPIMQSSKSHARRSDPADDALVYATRSIDDEYTPGTFTLDNWVTRASQYDALQTAASTAVNIANGYVQYKPIAYTKPNEYTVQNTVTVSSTSLLKNTADLLADDRLRAAVQRSIVTAFYQPSTVDATGVYQAPFTLSATNVTFGQVGDGFYRKTAWLKWTAQVGFGVPPQDAVSALVIIVILAGLGVPIVLMVAGGVYFGFRKWRANRIGYQRIN